MDISTTIYTIYTNARTTDDHLGSVGRHHLCYTDPPIVHNNGIVRN